MFEEEWTIDRLNELIDDEIEEGPQLDYKAADALGKSRGKKKEIAKDVSAMANSAGGAIIYGIKEFDDQDKKHLPEKLDPVDSTEFSREWLEQIIQSNIQPRLNPDKFRISPVRLPGPKTVYLVEVQQSSTAHMAADNRYYKRFQFETVPMEDWEVRDAMNRQKHPRLVPVVYVQHNLNNGASSIVAMLFNDSPVTAKYIWARVGIPSHILQRNTPNEIYHYTNNNLSSMYQSVPVLPEETFHVLSEQAGGSYFQGATPRGDVWVEVNADDAGRREYSFALDELPSVKVKSNRPHKITQGKDKFPPALVRRVEKLGHF